MIIETKYNTIDDFLCRFEGVHIDSVEFEYDHAKYTLSFRDYLEEFTFKEEFRVYMWCIAYLNNCFKLPYKTAQQNTIYKAINKNKNIFRKGNE